MTNPRHFRYSVDSIGEQVSSLGDGKLTELREIRSGHPHFALDRVNDLGTILPFFFVFFCLFHRKYEREGKRKIVRAR